MSMYEKSKEISGPTVKGKVDASGTTTSTFLSSGKR